MPTQEPLSVELNAICPYFTMFPLQFPFTILQQRAQPGDTVLDPFCGRGTTNFAARLLGLNSLGVDASPVAAAVTASKLVSVNPARIIREAQTILQTPGSVPVPEGEFWSWAYHPTVLEALCKFRHAFIQDCSSKSRVALRGIILGALHGPRQKTFPSYFSNQCPRTYAPKPNYSARFWQERELEPELIDVLYVIGRRARRYYAQTLNVKAHVRREDSRDLLSLKAPRGTAPFKWIITSPPYYGMRTYIPDQWLRNWFLGGPDKVDYNNRGQVEHSSAEKFAYDLRLVWCNCAAVSAPDATMVVRFGGISDRKVDPLELAKLSLQDSGWRIVTARKAGDALKGKRQADAFLKEKSKPVIEYDIWARPL